VISEKLKISLPLRPSENRILLATSENRQKLAIYQPYFPEILLYSSENLDQPPQILKLGDSPPKISKIHFYDQNTLSYLTQRGQFFTYDIRQSGHMPANVFQTSENSKADIIYTFDSIPSKHFVGIVDSCGGYEKFDVRNTKISLARQILQEFEDVKSILGSQFNLLYGQESLAGENYFVLSGMKQTCVPVFCDQNFSDQGQVVSIFRHQGHTKTVTNAFWHPTVPRLVFSTSIDSMLHAWQFNAEENPEICEK